MFGHCYALHTRTSRDTCRKRNEGPAVCCFPTFQVSSDTVGSSKSCLELYNYTTSAKKTPVTPSESEHLWTLWKAVFISSLETKLCSQHACVHEACLDFTGHERLALSESIQPLQQTDHVRKTRDQFACDPITWLRQHIRCYHPHVFITLSLFFHFHFQKS